MKLVAVLTAILFCRPTMPAGEAAAYARIVLDESVKVGVDPLLVIALVDRESRWQPGAVNAKSGALGLGQVLPQFQPPADRVKLLDGKFNLKTVFRVVATWKSMCAAKVGDSSEAAWLTMFTGAGVKGSLCGRRPTAKGWRLLPTPSLVRQYLARRSALRLRLESSPPSG